MTTRSVEHSVELRCHAQTPAAAVRSVRVDVTRTPGARLRLAFVLTGDLSALRVPPFRPPRAGSELWRHTCFEAFVAAAGAAAYHELNLAPSGEWAVLAFRGYREGGPVAGVGAPAIAVRASACALALDAVIALDALSPAYATAPLRLALATVAEETSGRRSYWAAHHPPGAPDFHHRDAFVARLEPPPDAC
jgi:hypothetical protein